MSGQIGDCFLLGVPQYHLCGYQIIITFVAMRVHDHCIRGIIIVIVVASLIYIHYIPFHSIPLHYITLHTYIHACMHAYIHTLHYIALHYITLHCITLHYIHTYIHNICIYIYIHTYVYIYTYVHTYFIEYNYPILSLSILSQLSFYSHDQYLYDGGKWVSGLGESSRLIVW